MLGIGIHCFIGKSLNTTVGIALLIINYYNQAFLTGPDQ